MDRINCNVIGDLLPLYADEVVSEDTKALVEEHLAECADCAEKYAQMKREIELNIGLKAVEAEKQAILAAKKKIRKKRIVTAVVSCIIGVIVIVAVVFILNNIRIPAVYEKERFKVDVREVGGAECMYLDYTGRMYTYDQYEVFDGEKLIWYVDIYSTPWSNLFDGENDATKHELFLTTLDGTDSTPIDELRYVEGDIWQMYSPTRDVDNMTENSVLLWERDDGLQFKAEPGTGENHTQ
ncbi:MAG: zf-HC2 domain-containing protein [Ruminococcus sp.]|nr:zf-HC2 domain-containing protein [Ruminococcus sp.]